MTLGTQKSWKVTPNEAQSDPKAAQVALGGPLKTYVIYEVGATLGHLWRVRKLILFLLISQAPTFLSF